MKNKSIIDQIIKSRIILCLSFGIIPNVIDSVLYLARTENKWNKKNDIIIINKL